MKCQIVKLSECSLHVGSINMIFVPEYIYIYVHNISCTMSAMDLVEMPATFCPAQCDLIFIRCSHQIMDLEAGWNQLGPDKFRFAQHWCNLMAPVLKFIVTPFLPFLCDTMIPGLELCFFPHVFLQNLAGLVLCFKLMNGLIRVGLGCIWNLLLRPWSWCSRCGIFLPALVSIILCWMYRIFGWWKLCQMALPFGLVIVLITWWLWSERFWLKLCSF